MYPDLEGIEFDWFAKDCDGNLALFATAGEGFFPASVEAHHEKHICISESLYSPNIGTNSVWIDYAALGLFVFDWDLPGGPYKLRATPMRQASAELVANIDAVPQLPRFSGCFSSLKELSKWR